MSAAPQLAGKRVLIVEDEYFVADDLRRAFAKADAEVVGPFASVAAALAAAREGEFDAAILDINLGGEMSYAVADSLLERGIPFVLATGYDDWAVPQRLSAAARLPKPFGPQAALDAVARMTAEAEQRA